MYKWLIVGTGWISDDFVDGLKKNNEEVTVICSRKIKTGKAFAEKHNIPNVTTKLESVTNLFDVVYIATPNIFHYEIAKKAILLGKKVLVEKPMTHSLALTKELYALADKYNTRIMEAYVHVSDPIVKTFHGKFLKMDRKQLSSRIANNTVKTAPSFSKEMFGGVIPDIGVYPIALSIQILGNVKNVEIVNVKYMNGVEISCDVKMDHINGKSEFSLSKTEDADMSVYLDGKKIFNTSSVGSGVNKMDAEIKLFISNEDLSWHRKISLETARIVELMKKMV